MPEKIRWGLLSTANINRRVIPAIRQSERGVINAVASRSQSAADAYANEWSIPKGFGTYQDLLSSKEVDAVYIGLPNHLHAEWSIKAMEAGLHVLCEKPFALTLDQVDTMMDTQKQTGRILAEAFMYRHHPQTKIVGDLIKNGKLGEVILLRGLFNFSINPRGLVKKNLNVRLIPEMGGGCLWDVGVYPLSFAQFIFEGPPDWVSGTQWLGAFGVDETFCGQMGYPDGGLAQISASFRAPYHTQVEIIGTQGRVVVTRPFTGLSEAASQIKLFHEDGKAEKISVPDEYLYMGEVEDMHSAILDGTSNYLKLTETRNHIKTVLALYESARTNSVIQLK